MCMCVLNICMHSIFVFSICSILNVLNRFYESCSRTMLVNGGCVLLFSGPMTSHFLPSWDVEGSIIVKDKAGVSVWLTTAYSYEKGSYKNHVIRSTNEASFAIDIVDFSILYNIVMLLCIFNNLRVPPCSFLPFSELSNYCCGSTPEICALHFQSFDQLMK